MYVEAGTAKDAFAITPNDDTVLRADALLIGVAGDISVITARGNTRTVPVQSGILPLTVTKVLATGTTATGIVGLVY